MMWLSVLFVCFVWWFSTGAILLAVRRADRAGGTAHLRTAMAAIPLTIVGVAFIWFSRETTGLVSPYVGFIGALAIWGAIELSFLTGVVTGPSKLPQTVSARGTDRLWQAWQAIYYHELLLAAGLMVIVVMTDGDTSSVAFGTYTVLFLARILAKLNLFFGVPRINVEFVPQPLQHLSSYFRKGPVTLAFPLAISFLTFTTACFLFQVSETQTVAIAMGWVLLSTLAALALLEHWLMVVPLPDAALWRWMLPKPAQDKTLPERYN